MLSFSLNGTSYGDILGDSNVKRIGRSKGGGKITSGELLVVCGIDLSSIGVGIIPPGFAGLGKISFGLVVFAAAWNAAA